MYDMVTIVDNIASYNQNLLTVELKGSHQKIWQLCAVTDMLINLMAGSFHSVYIYQIIILYTLNILQCYLSIIPQ